MVYSGKGTITVKRNLVRVEHNLTTRRVVIKVDGERSRERRRIRRRSGYDLSDLRYEHN